MELISATQRRCGTFQLLITALALILATQSFSGLSLCRHYLATSGRLHWPTSGIRLHDGSVHSFICFHLEFAQYKPFIAHTSNFAQILGEYGKRFLNIILTLKNDDHCQTLTRRRNKLKHKKAMLYTVEV